MSLPDVPVALLQRLSRREGRSHLQQREEEGEERRGVTRRWYREDLADCTLRSYATRSLQRASHEHRGMNGSPLVLGLTVWGSEWRVCH